MDRIEKLVTNPSLGALVYQAHTLVDELNKIHNVEFPPEACCIRDICLCIAEYVEEQLWNLDIQNTAEPFLRMSKLGEAVQQLYSQIRFLRASSPSQSPPAIQNALTSLTSIFFANEQSNKPICLIRPQWKYNLTYIPFTSDLNRIISAAVLDPETGLGVDKINEVTNALWIKWQEKQKQENNPYHKKNVGKQPPPIAILSFAGLDTNDTLLYPLLAHELGHFLDLNSEPPHHRLIQQDRVTNALLNIKSIIQKLDKSIDPESESELIYQITNDIYVCYRELLADMLAVRMLGISYFISQYEFLKTIADWQENIITQGGYPGMKFRLYVVLKQLNAEGYSGNIKTFLLNSNEPYAKQLLKFLTEWENKLDIQIQQ